MKYINKMKKLLMLNVMSNVMLNVNSHDKCKYTVYNDLSRVNNENIDENVILDSRIEIMKNEIAKNKFTNITKKFIKINKEFKEIQVNNTSFNGILTKRNQQIKLNKKRNELRLQQDKWFEKQKLLRVSKNQLEAINNKYKELFIIVTN